MLLPRENYENLTGEQLRALLDAIRNTRVGVLGDFCLDAYWFIDPAASEISLETGLETRPIAGQRYELGGAGNVVNNMVALGCPHIEVFGVIGPDPWGREMLRLMQPPGVRTEGLLVESWNWSTSVFIKPHLRDEETNRLDFGNFNQLSAPTADRLLALLAARLDQLDALVINEQVHRGIHNDYLRPRLADLISRHPAKVFVVNSRHYSGAYPGAYLVLNDREAAQQVDKQYPIGALVLQEDVRTAARALLVRRGRPVFITRGARGVVVCDRDDTHEIPAIQVLDKIDPVGAGDSLLAGVTLALAAGANPVLAATLGNIVACITIQKLQQTGTASPQEILAVGPQPDYIYQPELAEDMRDVQYLPGTEIERITGREPPRKITHVIFDHDGTLSTLREGWEQIMAPVMIRAILGPQYQSADESLYHRVVDRVREYIDKSTGLQTLAQMQGLIRMVREFGCVPHEEVLDEHGYKRIYNDELMKLVRRRIEKLEKRELDVEDYSLKNAVPLLRAQHQAGAKLYLASGTDQQDLVKEAEALGYAGLFAGRIYGAVGDLTKEAKRMVLERILHEISAAAEGLVTFGDGPVEIRETHKRGGYAIGVASDEVRRFGLNEIKRGRLIRAGADLIVSDYSQLPRLLAFLHLN